MAGEEDVGGIYITLGVKPDLTGVDDWNATLDEMTEAREAKVSVSLMGADTAKNKIEQLERSASRKGGATSGARSETAESRLVAAFSKLSASLSNFKISIDPDSISAIGKAIRDAVRGIDGDMAPASGPPPRYAGGGASFIGSSGWTVANEVRAQNQVYQGPVYLQRQLAVARAQNQQVRPEAVVRGGSSSRRPYRKDPYLPPPEEARGNAEGSPFPPIEMCSRCTEHGTAAQMAAHYLSSGHSSPRRPVGFGAPTPTPAPTPIHKPRVEPTPQPPPTPEPAVASASRKKAAEGHPILHAVGPKVSQEKPLNPLIHERRTRAHPAAGVSFGAGARVVPTSDDPAGNLTWTWAHGRSTLGPPASDPRIWDGLTGVPRAVPTSRHRDLQALDERYRLAIANGPLSPDMEESFRIERENILAKIKAPKGWSQTRDNRRSILGLFGLGAQRVSVERGPEGTIPAGFKACDKCSAVEKNAGLLAIHKNRMHPAPLYEDAHAAETAAARAAIEAPAPDAKVLRPSGGEFVNAVTVGDKRHGAPGKASVFNREEGKPVWGVVMRAIEDAARGDEEINQVATSYRLVPGVASQADLTKVTDEEWGKLGLKPDATDAQKRSALEMINLPAHAEVIARHVETLGPGRREVIRLPKNLGPFSGLRAIRVPRDVRFAEEVARARGLSSIDQLRQGSGSTAREAAIFEMAREFLDEYPYPSHAISETTGHIGKQDPVPGPSPEDTYDASLVKFKRPGQEVEVGRARLGLTPQTELTGRVATTEHGPLAFGAGASAVRDPETGRNTGWGRSALVTAARKRFSKLWGSVEARLERAKEEGGEPGYRGPVTGTWIDPQAQHYMRGLLKGQRDQVDIPWDDPELINIGNMMFLQQLGDKEDRRGPLPLGDGKFTPDYTDLKKYPLTSFRDVSLAWYGRAYKPGQPMRPVPTRKNPETGLTERNAYVNWERVAPYKDDEGVERKMGWVEVPANPDNEYKAGALERLRNRFGFKRKNPPRAISALSRAVGGWLNEMSGGVVPRMGVAPRKSYAGSSQAREDALRDQAQQWKEIERQPGAREGVGPPEASEFVYFPDADRLRAIRQEKAKLVAAESHAAKQAEHPEWIARPEKPEQTEFTLLAPIRGEHKEVFLPPRGRGHKGLGSTLAELEAQERETLQRAIDYPKTPEVQAMGIYAQRQRQYEADVAQLELDRITGAINTSTPVGRADADTRYKALQKQREELLTSGVPVDEVAEVRREKSKAHDRERKRFAREHANRPALQNEVEEYESRQRVIALPYNKRIAELTKAPPTPEEAAQTAKTKAELQEEMERKLRSADRKFRGQHKGRAATVDEAIEHGKRRAEIAAPYKLKIAELDKGAEPLKDLVARNAASAQADAERAAGGGAPPRRTRRARAGATPEPEPTPSTVEATAATSAATTTTPAMGGGGQIHVIVDDIIKGTVTITNPTAVRAEKAAAKTAGEARPKDKKPEEKTAPKVPEFGTRYGPKGGARPVIAAGPVDVRGESLRMLGEVMPLASRAEREELRGKEANPETLEAQAKVHQKARDKASFAGLYHEARTNYRDELLAQWNASGEPDDSDPEVQRTRLLNMGLGRGLVEQALGPTPDVLQRQADAARRAAATAERQRIATARRDPTSPEFAAHQAELAAAKAARDQIKLNSARTEAARLRALPDFEPESLRKRFNRAYGTAATEDEFVLGPRPGRPIPLQPLRERMLAAEEPRGFEGGTTPESRAAARFDQVVTRMAEHYNAVRAMPDLARAPADYVLGIARNRMITEIEAGGARDIPPGLIDVDDTEFKKAVYRKAGVYAAPESAARGPGREQTLVEEIRGTLSQAGIEAPNVDSGREISHEVSAAIYGERIDETGARVPIPAADYHAGLRAARDTAQKSLPLRALSTSAIQTIGSMFGPYESVRKKAMEAAKKEKLLDNAEKELQKRYQEKTAYVPKLAEATAKYEADIAAGVPEAEARPELDKITAQVQGLNDAYDAQVTVTKAAKKTAEEYNDAIVSGGDQLKHFAATFVGGIAGSFIGAMAAAVAKPVIEAALSVAKPVVGPMIDQALGYSGTRARVMSELTAATTQASGIGSTAFASKYMNVPAASTEFAAPVVSQAETIAAAKQFESFRDLYRTMVDMPQVGAGLDPALFMSEGPVRGMGLFAEYKGMSELVGSQFLDKAQGRQWKSGWVPGYNYQPPEDAILQVSKRDQEWADTLNLLMGGVEGTSAKYIVQPAQTLMPTETAEERVVREKAMSDAGLGAVAASGFAVVDAKTGKAVTDFYELGEMLKQIKTAFKRVQAEQFVTSQAPQIAAQVGGMQAQRQFALDFTNPVQRYMDYITNVPLAPGTGVLPGMNAKANQAYPAMGYNLEKGMVPLDQSVVGSYDSLTGAIKKSQDALAGLAAKGRSALEALNVPTETIDQIEQYGKSIAATQEEIGGIQANLNWTQHERDATLAKRAVTDLTQLTGKLGKTNGDNVGYYERQLLLINRASTALSLQLQERQITTQEAVAGFAVQGDTPEIRMARRKEAELEASIARKQLGYSKQAFGVEIKLVDATNLRNLKDAIFSLQSLQRTFHAGITIGLKQQDIENMQKVMASLVPDANAWISYFAGYEQYMIGLGVQLASLTEGTVKDMVGSIRKELNGLFPGMFPEPKQTEGTAVDPRWLGLNRSDASGPDAGVRLTAIPEPSVRLTAIPEPGTWSPTRGGGKKGKSGVGAAATGMSQQAQDAWGARYAGYAGSAAGYSPATSAGAVVNNNNQKYENTSAPVFNVNVTQMNQEAINDLVTQVIKNLNAVLSQVGLRPVAR